MLSDKIWITRKTRIYAEQRLQRNSNIAELLMIVYSLALVSLSIWNLESNNPRLNVVSAFASIVVLVASVFLSSQKYTERSVAMRNCYVKLDELNSQVKRAESGKDAVALADLESEYTDILINVENHSEYDYLCFRFSQRENKDTTLPPFMRRDHVRYCWETAWRVVLVIILFAIALLPTILIWL